MKILFFLVHPAKFHQTRNTINTLKEAGYIIDIIIIGRDILEELVSNEGWEYKIIFSKGRRINWLHIWISAGIFLALTILKLYKLTSIRKYDLFITDDCLTFVGRIRKTPSVFLTDDDLSAVPESRILMATANYILAPDICDLGKYNNKKWGYWGYKSLFHLHPNIFTPDMDKINHDLKNTVYFFIRCVSVTSTHDVGKRGISDDVLRKLIIILKDHGGVVINSERELPKDLLSYVLDIHKNDISHYVYYSKIFISDSTTMCAEASVMGVPSIEFDDWFYDFNQYLELNGKYQLLYGFANSEEQRMYAKIHELLAIRDLRSVFETRRLKLFTEKIDASAFFIWMIKNYPLSSEQYFNNKSVQSRFISKTL